MTPKMRETYESPYQQYKERIGQKFSLVRVIPAEEATPDYDTPEPMYLIRFEDGEEIEAWEEEVFVLDL